MTICRQWAWKPNDQLKSLAECIHTLVYVVGGDGNLLLNVGPMPDGRIEPRQADRLREIGAWLQRFGAGIYGTRGGPFRPGRWGASTCRDDLIYLFIMRWPEDGPLLLPPIESRILAARSLSGGEVDVQQTDEAIRVALVEDQRDAIVTVIRLQVDQRAFDITPVDVPVPPSGSLAFGGEATASNVFRAMPEYGPDKAIDDDPETRWATDAGTHQAWLDVALPEASTVGRVVIVEGQWDRVRRYEIQVRTNAAWATVASGERLGPRTELRFPPVRADHVRLNILEATEGPTIWEFQVFPK